MLARLFTNGDAGASLISHSGAYRRDIDGLRAIAVLAVVLFHFGMPGFQGGFVGVDVFFVISGYLIGGLLWREYRETGTIWLTHFYVRRFRRLMPAFFVMALATTAVAWLLMLPFEFREYGKTLISATAYLSNVYFYTKSGYFDTEAEEKPLLHTWSLSVEEQFYIFLPLFLLVLMRFRWAVVPLLTVIFFVSLGVSVVVTPQNQPAAFYLFPFRAWEMMAGVLLAIAGQRFNWTWHGSPFLSYVGAILVVASIALVPPDEAFPGYVAFFPVLGTVMLLSSGRGKNIVNNTLSSPFFVFFGLISYSLYLWHWPVFTLSTYLRGGYASLFEAFLWVLVAVVLGALSWRFVEVPIRRAARLPGFVVLTGAALASGSLLAAGAFLYVKDGVPDRFGPAVRPHIDASADFLQDFSRCTVPVEGPLMGIEVCPIGPEGDPQVLVWGDSHVRAFKEGIDLAAHEQNVPGILIWRAGCAPLFDVRKIESYATPAEDQACANANLQIKQSFNALPSLKSILLVGRWSYYAHGTGVGLDAENTIQVWPKNGSLSADRNQQIVFANAARDTLLNLYQRFETVSVLRQPPEIPFYDSRVAARETAHSAWPFAAKVETQADVRLSEALARSDAGEAPFKMLHEEGMLNWIDPWPKLCSDSTCSALIDGKGYYFDNNHVTNTAALMLRHLFAPVFANLEFAHSTGASQ